MRKKKPTNESICLARSKYCKWRNACVQSWYCQRVSLGLQHWRAHIFVQLCKCICAVVQMYLCNCTNEFVQSYKCICAIVQMYLCNGTNVFVQLYFFNCAELFVQPSDHCLSTCACSPWARACPLSVVQGVPDPLPQNPSTSPCASCENFDLV